MHAGNVHIPTINPTIRSSRGRELVESNFFKTTDDEVQPPLEQSAILTDYATSSLVFADRVRLRIVRIVSRHEWTHLLQCRHKQRAAATQLYAATSHLTQCRVAVP